MHAATVGSTLLTAARWRAPPAAPLQLLVLAILVTTGAMCAVKAFMDARVLPFVTSDHAAPKRMDAKKGGGGGAAAKKKQGAMDVIK